MLLSAPVAPPPLPCQAGAFKIGDTAGTLDNIIACKLYRPGSVGFVSKSGGMSNEMYNVLSRATDGLYEGEGGLRLEVVQGFASWGLNLGLNLDSVGDIHARHSRPWHGGPLHTLGEIFQPSTRLGSHVGLWQLTLEPEAPHSCCLTHMLTVLTCCCLQVLPLEATPSPGRRLATTASVTRTSHRSR